jgi:hypothetical protein
MMFNDLKFHGFIYYIRNIWWIGFQWWSRSIEYVKVAFFKNNKQFIFGRKIMEDQGTYCTNTLKYVSQWKHFILASVGVSIPLLIISIQEHGYFLWEKLGYFSFFKYFKVTIEKHSDFFLKVMHTHREGGDLS